MSLARKYGIVLTISPWVSGDGGGLEPYMLQIGNKTIKEVPVHCYCASLLRTQIHMPRHALSVHAKHYQ